MNNWSIFTAGEAEDLRAALVLSVQQDLYFPETVFEGCLLSEQSSSS